MNFLIPKIPKIGDPIETLMKMQPHYSQSTIGDKMSQDTFAPTRAFLRFTDFKRRKCSFSPVPSMQCCADVRATYRKQQTPQL